MNPLKLTVTAVLASLVALLPPPHAQELNRDAFEDILPPSGAEAAPAAPKMAFSLLAEIPLPGPLPGAGPRVNGELVEIPVAGGTAVTLPVPDATPRMEATVEESGAAAEADPWVGDGERRRFRSEPGGWIVAQRRCERCRKGWKKVWKLRVPGNTLAPPLVGDDRVYFGALDNRIYCVKAKNGHRLWVTEVAGRVSRPLVFWKWPDEPLPGDADSGVEPPTDRDESGIVLVVTDAGRQMLALSAADGLRVAMVQILPAEGRFVSVPVALPDGLVAVAQQKYTESEAALRVYRLQPIAPAGPRPDLDYNAPDLQPVSTMEDLDGATEGRLEGQDDPGAGS